MGNNRTTYPPSNSEAVDVCRTCIASLSSSAQQHWRRRGHKRLSAVRGRRHGTATQCSSSELSDQKFALSTRHDIDIDIILISYCADNDIRCFNVSECHPECHPGVDFQISTRFGGRRHITSHTLIK